MNFKRNTYVVLLGCSIQLMHSSPLFAAHLSGEAHTNEQEDALLTLIQLMESDIATKTEKLDADYLPGLVTVLDGNDLRARGFQTVADALNTVPGFQIQISNVGLHSAVVRGMGGVLANVSGKLKLMVNGAGINSTQSAKGDALYNIPINQVERIEIIRGPGSAVYGEFAYSGVINVTTRKNVNSVQASTGTDNTRYVGGNYSRELDTDVAFNLSSSYHSTDGDSPTVQDDAATNNDGYIKLISNAPEKINKAREFKQIHADLQVKQFKLNADYLENNFGSYYGINHSVPTYQKGELNSLSKWTLLDASYTFAKPDHHFESTLSANWMKYHNAFIDVDLFTSTTDVGKFNLQADPSTYTLATPYTYQSNTFYSSIKQGVKSETRWAPSEMYHLFLGLEYSALHDYNSYAVNNFTPFVSPTYDFVTTEGKYSTLPEGLKREISGVVLQNQITLNKDFEVTVGVRHDHYVDVGDSTTPRIAAVYQVTDHHILKAQYGEAFRPPSFTELYSSALLAQGNRHIKPETIRTRELAYIYKTPNLVFRSTAFYSTLDNLITLFIQPFGYKYDNAHGANLKGIELELEQQISDQLKWQSNLSWVDSEDKDTDQTLENTISTLANVGLLYQPSKFFTMNTEIKYVSSPQRVAVDPRDEVDSYVTTALTLNGINVMNSGLGIQLHIENLLDEEYQHPTAFASGVTSDHQQNGRSYVAQVSYQF